MCRNLKFGIGLQLVKMSKEEFLSIVDEFHNYISYIYYSSLLDYKFYARKILKQTEMERFRNIDPNDQYDILEYARSKYGIKTELAVNSYTCKDDISFIEMFKYELSHHKPDKCVTYNRLVNDLYDIESRIEYELSFNEGLTNISHINKLSSHFSSVVIGGRFIRDVSMINKILESGRTPNILINNSCAHNCGYCGRCDCEFIFKNNLHKCQNDINIPFAIQTLLPWEIYDNSNIYKDNYVYKLSTRLCGYNELRYLLHSYINNFNNVIGYDQFHAMCPLRWFEKYYDDIDLEMVNEYKRLIWSKIKSCDEV